MSTETALILIAVLAVLSLAFFVRGAWKWSKATHLKGPGGINGSAHLQDNVLAAEPGAATATGESFKKP
ncbi:hypothetical protein ABC977_14170 [Thioalkalicoccus limnaeus]|uniref:Uncharacterized protein n=1 Tax=Thioalkalicoccus limnaeus TaxID=120681 RepID=A0ABV4BHU1_9GAMM